MRTLSHLVIALAVTSLGSTIASAQTIAYDVPLQAGNQAFAGNLGLDFDVNQPIVVNALGVFDSKGDGISAQVAVQIFNRDTAAAVGTSLVFHQDGTLTNGSRFKSLGASSFILPAGHYSVVAVGFGVADLAGNLTVGLPFFASTENTGGGLISFVGNGRFDNNTTLDLPAGIIPGLPSNVFLAGTFQFAAATRPTISKTFGAAVISQTQTTSLSFTIVNTNAAPLTGVGFTDTLPAGLIVATPNGLTPANGCNGTLPTATAGSTTISLANATLGINASCTFSVTVTGVTPGTQINTTSTLSSNEVAPGDPATARITVIPGDAYQVSYVSNLNIGDSFINLTNTGVQDGFDPAGNICANIYVIDPAQEVLACCSCPLTPNHLKSVSVVNDLGSRLLTPGTPTSLTVALLASTTCNAATVNSVGNNLVGGLRAWGTKLHATPVAGKYAVTETPFSPSFISPGELSKLTLYCGFIQANGSQFGICGSCKQGALGAAKQ